jgi:hypothetical protein
VAEPLAFTEPFNVVAVEVIALADPVVGIAGLARVLKLTILPQLVPPPFWATTR